LPKIGFRNHCKLTGCAFALSSFGGEIRSISQQNINGTEMDDSKLRLDRRVLYTATNWALFIPGIINLGIGTYYAFRGDPTVAATSLAAGLVLLFAATIDRFESIKGLGLEAKTRQLDRKLEEADEALARLTELTELCGAALIDLTSRAGRLVQPPAPRDAYALAQRVKNMMQKGGSTPSAVTKALEPWAWILCQDLAGVVLAPIHKALQKRAVDLGRIQSAIPNPVNPTNPEWFRVRTEMRDISEYREALSRIRAAELDEFPDRLLALFNDVPSASASEVAAAQGESKPLCPRDSSPPEVDGASQSGALVRGARC
jgi:hypothetical protein